MTKRSHEISHYTSVHNQFDIYVRELEQLFADAEDVKELLADKDFDDRSRQRCIDILTTRFERVLKASQPKVERTITVEKKKT